MINAVHCRLIVFICSDQLREYGRSKEKGGGIWGGGRPVLFTLTLALSHRGRGDVAPGTAHSGFPPARE